MIEDDVPNDPPGGGPSCPSWGTSLPGGLPGWPAPFLPIIKLQCPLPGFPSQSCQNCLPFTHRWLQQRLWAWETEKHHQKYGCTAGRGEDLLSCPGQFCVAEHAKLKELPSARPLLHCRKQGPCHPALERAAWPRAAVGLRRRRLRLRGQQQSTRAGDPRALRLSRSFGGAPTPDLPAGSPQLWRGRPQRPLTIFQTKSLATSWSWLGWITGEQAGG